jgi:adenosylhomocysteinase
MSRILDITLASAFSEEERAWLSVIRPVTAQYCRTIAGRDYSGRTVVLWAHVLPDSMLNVLPLLQAGARVRVGACNPDSTDDRVAAWLVQQGADVFAKSGMSTAEYRENLEELAAGPADVLCDMGGELVEASAAKGAQVMGGLEATTSGIHRLQGLDLPFPVFNWNDIALKDRLHNRYHVGDSTWPVFTEITGMGLFGRSVLVIGFGPVGQGVAERARAMGAIVSVVDPDPVRQLEAQHFGCQPVTLEEGLKRCSVIVTATGLNDVVGPAALQQVRDGAVLFNVGHGNREYDVDYLDQHPRATMRPHIERYELEDRCLYLLNRGSLLNLASGTAGHGVDLFDPFSAIMLQGISWILEGGARRCAPGVQDYPHELEREIAELTVRGRT